MTMMRLWREWLLLFDVMKKIKTKKKKIYKKNEKGFSLCLRELMILKRMFSIKWKFLSILMIIVWMMKIYGLMPARSNVMYDHIIVHVILATN